MSEATTQPSTEGQIAFAAEKGIQGFTTTTPRNEASRLIGDWCEANPKPQAQKDAEWQARLERLRGRAASPAQQAIADKVTGGKLVLKNQAHAQAFMSRLGRRAPAAAAA
jgi:hypothetical protein